MVIILNKDKKEEPASDKGRGLEIVEAAQEAVKKIGELDSVKTFVITMMFMEGAFAKDKGDCYEDVIDKRISEVRKVAIERNEPRDFMGELFIANCISLGYKWAENNPIKKSEKKDEND